MNIGDFSEHDFLQKVFGTFASTARPDAFDDCVVVDLSDVTGVPGLPYLVYSMDHPSRVPHPLVSRNRFYGRWVAAVTCNDVVAMGARCQGFSLDLSAPLDTNVEDIQEILQGLRDVLDQYGATYEGGNFDASNLETVGFCWGVVARHGLVRRSGARPGDWVCVTGELGRGWAEYLIRKNERYEELEPDLQQSLRSYKEMPVGAHRAIAIAAEQECFTSGMDLSDGLVDFLYTVARRNNLGVRIEAENLPVSAITQSVLPLVLDLTGAPPALLEYPTLCGLDAGYDSPLVHGFTVRPDKWETALELFRSEGSPLHRIGTVTPDAGVFLEAAGRRAEIPAFWDDQCLQDSLTVRWRVFLQQILAQLGGGPL